MMWSQEVNTEEVGYSLRDEFALEALKELIKERHQFSDSRELAYTAYDIADAMMEARGDE